MVIDINVGNTIRRIRHYCTPLQTCFQRHFSISYCTHLHAITRPHFELSTLSFDNYVFIFDSYVQNLTSKKSTYCIFSDKCKLPKRWFKLKIGVSSMCNELMTSLNLGFKARQDDDLLKWAKFQIYSTIIFSRQTKF